MKSPLYFILLLCFVTSCSTPQEQDLEATLTFAGTNRSELEKVLHHYKDESATKMTIDRKEYDKHPVPPGQTMDFEGDIRSGGKRTFHKSVDCVFECKNFPRPFTDKGGDVSKQ